MGGDRLHTAALAFQGCEVSKRTKLRRAERTCAEQRTRVRLEKGSLMATNDDEKVGGRKLQSTGSSSSWPESRDEQHHRLRGEEKNVEVGSELVGAELCHNGHGI